MHKVEVVRKTIVQLASTFTAVLFLVSAVKAADEAEQDPLLQAQRMEAKGQYATAASAYLAIIEGFDFVPGPSHSKEFAVLDAGQRSIIGKCAVNCIEKGIKQHTSSGAKLYDCIEFELLGGAASSMMKLEAQNPKWIYLRAFTLMHHGNYKEADSLLDSCLALCSRDAAIEHKALKAKAEIKQHLVADKDSGPSAFFQF